MAKTKQKKKSPTLNKQQQHAQVEKIKKDFEKFRMSNAALRDLLRATGGLDRINELLSSAYLLQSFANTFVEETQQVLELFGMKGGSLGILFKKAQRSNDDYFDAFYRLICENDEESLKTVRQGVRDDYNKLEEAFYAAFPEKSETWEPDLSVDEKLKEIEQKYGIVIKKIRDGEGE